MNNDIYAKHAFSVDPIAGTPGCTPGAGCDDEDTLVTKKYVDDNLVVGGSTPLPPAPPPGSGTGLTGTGGGATMKYYTGNSCATCPWGSVQVNVGTIYEGTMCNMKTDTGAVIAPGTPYYNGNWSYATNGQILLSEMAWCLVKLVFLGAGKRRYRNKDVCEYAGVCGENKICDGE